MNCLARQDYEIKKETEKAVLIKFYSEYGKLEKWFPKSTIKSEYEIKSEEELKLRLSQQKQIALDKHYNLIKWAKAQGIKGIRPNMKKVTILDKIKGAGIELPEEFF